MHQQRVKLFNCVLGSIRDHTMKEIKIGNNIVKVAGLFLISISCIAWSSGHGSASQLFIDRGRLLVTAGLEAGPERRWCGVCVTFPMNSNHDRKY
jgi:hypothetical protein